MIKPLLIAMLAMSMASCVTKGSSQKGSYLLLAKEGKTLQRKVAEGQTADLSNIKVHYKKKPDQQFTELAVVESFVSGYDVNLESLFAGLKLQAYLAGADGIYKIEVSRYNNSGSAISGTAIAISYK